MATQDQGVAPETTTSLSQELPGPPPPYIVGIRISGVEKRHQPNKHYAYVFRILWNNGKETTAIRAHIDVFNFHCKLLDTYPDEAGTTGGKRSLPTLPGKHAQAKTAGKAANFSFGVEEWAKKLIALPKVGKSEAVWEFFKSTPLDLNFVDLERTLGAHDSKQKGMFADEEDTDAGAVEIDEDTDCLAAGVAKCDAQDPDEVDPSRANSMFVKNKLPYKRGDKLYVLRMTDCPGQHWWCRDDKGNKGHVPSVDVEVDVLQIAAEMQRLATMSSKQKKERKQQQAVAKVASGQPPQPATKDEMTLI
eukprot:m.108766 g.108766  ORF g.108766 m.108766 type:complete len:305 (+) comp13354_c0_seq5:132-1046(+)